MKKTLIAIVSSILLLTGLIGSSFVFAEDTEDTEKITMLVPGYDTGYVQKELDAGIAAFKEETGKTVEIIPVGWDELNTKIVQLAQANQSPDILFIGTRSLRQFAEEGIIRALDDFVTPEFVEPRIESVFKTAEFNGKQYGVPAALSCRALIYRSDLIDEAPGNWDELLETAQQIKAENDIYGFYLPFDAPGTSIETMHLFYQNEGFPVDEEGNYTVNSPEIVETAKYMKQFVDEELVPNPLDSERVDQVKMFVNGDLAMFVTGAWDLEVLEENKEEYPYGVALIPEGKQRAVNIATDAYTITEGAKNPEGAWEFINFMGQAEFQRPISEHMNWFPILKEEEDDERFDTEEMKPFVEMIQFGFADPHTPSWDEFHKAFTLALQEAITGSKDPQEAFNQAQSTLEK